MNGRVHVVDDELLVRRALERLLRSEGHAVQSYSGLNEFLESANLNEPACLVLDLHFPDDNGLGLLETLAARRGPICTVVLTGRADVSNAVRAMKSGAFEFLEKPFENCHLLDVVSRAVMHADSLHSSWIEQNELNGRFERLSPRQREVFRLVVEGLPNKVIAGRLRIAEKTVKVHRAEVMRRMAVDSLAQLVRLATCLEDRAGMR